MAKYKVLVGLDYPTPKGAKRAEIGDVVDDLPKSSLEWLLRQNCIEPLEEEGGDN